MLIKTHKRPAHIYLSIFDTFVKRLVSHKATKSQREKLFIINRLSPCPLRLRVKIRLFTRALILVFLLLLPIAPIIASAQHITASGCSVSNVGYLSDLVKEYKKRTGIEVLVRGGGSVVGLEDLQAGRVDFAASCRVKSADDPEDLEFIQVAWDALVFIVHPSSPLNNISPDSVRAIYGDKISDWSQLKGSKSPIKLFISRPKAGLSGVEDSTKKLVLKGGEIVVTPDTTFLASTGIVEQMVEKTPEGFATVGFSSARKRNVKMLKVNGVSPTKENIAKDKYPFRRPLFIVVGKEPKPEVKNFIDFTLSKEGQQLISSLGVVSLMDVKK